MTVPEAAIKILQEYPDGLSAKKVTDEILAHKLHPLPAKDPVQIVARAMNRHCIGIDRSYSCQDRFFTASKDNTGLLIYKLVPGTVPTVASIIGSFTFPRQQVLTINNSKGAKTGAKTRIMDAENQSVRDLLGKYCFHVPDYQRSYSWNSENIDEFLDDLFNVVHSTQADARHFLGAVTMAKRDEQHDAVDLIDGQQRMTTIFLFLYVILGQYRSARFADKATGRADELLRKLAYLNDDGERTGSRLVLGEFNRAFFDDFIIDGHNKSDEDREHIKSSYQAKHEFAQNQAIYDAFNKMKLMVEERLDCCQSEEDAYDYLKALHICVLDRFEIVTMIIDMRFAIPCQKLEEGNFHDKFGIFYKGNDALSFSGSINDSKHGFQNYESVKVFKTWAGTQEYVDADASRFEKIWNRKDRNLKMFTIPQAVKDKIFELRTSDRPYSLPAGSSKWIHQDMAVKTFLEKEHGILAMATGTGKTVTAMKIINKLFDSGDIRRVIITMYGNDLLDQWAIQIRENYKNKKINYHYAAQKMMKDFVMHPDDSILILSRDSKNLSRLLELFDRLPGD